MDSKEGLYALFKYATEGILIADSKGKIIRINPSAEKLFGYQPNELIGEQIELLVPNRYKDKHHHHRQNYVDAPYPRSMGKNMDLYARKKNGVEFPIEISLSNYEVNGEINVIAFIIDITERKQAEIKLKSYSSELEKRVEDRTLMLREAIAELERTQDEMNAALAKEKELNDLKSRFVSMASHEFRTPLSTILSSVALIAKYNAPELGDKRQKHILRIRSMVLHLTEILNDLLSLGKLEEGMVQANPAFFDITNFGNEVIQEMMPVAKPGQLIKFNHSGDEKTVFLDNKLLKNILINLLSNAIKFSSEGDAIEIATRIGKNEIIITVKDHGMGIAKEDQQHLFERFFRGQNVVNIQGTGLGLNIVTKYVELMNGTIDFESKLNKGTTFIIKFPVQ